MMLGSPSLLICLLHWIPDGSNATFSSYNICTTAFKLPSNIFFVIMHLPSFLWNNKYGIAHLNKETQDSQSIGVLSIYRSFCIAIVLWMDIHNVQLRKRIRVKNKEETIIWQNLSHDYFPIHTSIGYLMPSTVCSEPFTELPLPQWRWNCTLVYVLGRPPPSTIILSPSRLTTTKKAIKILLKRLTRLSHKLLWPLFFCFLWKRRRIKIWKLCSEAFLMLLAP